ncbi:hypothetical protein [Bacillus alkalicola]|uniref:Uncharacterized protein n=1 Tax=Evansella alkalicola TaxID=745819 RepID=A0ABS6JNX4_9BACI|nr:hypothetical protein [Bacillus alkalicola]MBU9719962.1 hypothetical protein [Bacillus alkalicola]
MEKRKMMKLLRSSIPLTQVSYSKNGLDASWGLPNTPSFPVKQVGSTVVKNSALGAIPIVGTPIPKAVSQ